MTYSPEVSDTVIPSALSTGFDSMCEGSRPTCLMPWGGDLPFPFFPGILLSTKPPATQGKRTRFWKERWLKKMESTPTKKQMALGGREPKLSLEAWALFGLRPLPRLHGPKHPRSSTGTGRADFYSSGTGHWAPKNTSCWLVLQRSLPKDGYGSKLEPPGSGPQVVALVSICQGKPCWVPIFDPQPWKADEHCDSALQILQSLFPLSHSA